MSARLISVEGVHKAYADNAVLRGIDLTVDAHEVVVLIGASGSGKSTLLRCVNGLEPVDAGRILLDGDVEVTALDADLDLVRRRIGIVFQSFNLFPHMSVLDNITIAPRKVLGRSSSDAEATARELLATFGLEDRAGSYPDRPPAVSSSGWRSCGRWPWTPR
jgi:polar amino acid transport system ATP-binding protein